MGAARDEDTDGGATPEAAIGSNGDEGGQRDFVYAGKQKRRKFRYICRLFCKELVRHNFQGLQTDELLERMIELSLYTEEHLK